MKDFICCGLIFPSLHDLLLHHEEIHAQTQGAFGASSKPIKDEGPSDDLDMQVVHPDEGRTKTQSHLGGAEMINQMDNLTTPTTFLCNLGDNLLSRGELFFLTKKSIHPDVEPIRESTSHNSTEAPNDTARDIENEGPTSDKEYEMEEAFESFTPFSSIHDDKHFECPGRGCEKVHSTHYVPGYGVIDYETKKGIRYVSDLSSSYSMVTKTSI